MSFKALPNHSSRLQEQEAIAEVLSSLDDKIDLLKRQNKTLEGMAEALFRQWFIEEAQDDWEEVELNDHRGKRSESTMKPEKTNHKVEVRLVGLEHFRFKVTRFESLRATPRSLGSQKYKFAQRAKSLFGKASGPTSTTLLFRSLMVFAQPTFW